MEANPTTNHQERIVRVQNGWAMLLALLTILAADLALFLYFVAAQSQLVVICIVAFPLILILSKGFFSLQPNEARVLVLFGSYKGTVRASGLHWGNPFYTDGRKANGQSKFLH